jgi:DNA-directed RNA polymerase subunit RPC12/RpoP
MITKAMTTMVCPRCRTKINPESINTGKLVPCESCGVKTLTRVFPALYQLKQSINQPGKTNASSDDRPSKQEIAFKSATEAGCFFHADKKAGAHCDHCGRFLCSLCDIDFEGGHICVTCLESGKKAGTLKSIEKTRYLFDGIALVFALMPMTILLWFTAVFSAPASFYISCRYWNDPGSILPRTKIRYILSLIISFVQMVLMAAGIYFLTLILMK